MSEQLRCFHSWRILRRISHWWQLLVVLVVLALAVGIGTWVWLTPTPTPTPTPTGKPHYLETVLPLHQPRGLRTEEHAPPPWQAMTPIERMVADKNIASGKDFGIYSSNDYFPNQVSAKTYYSTPLCTPGDLKTHIYGLTETLPLPPHVLPGPPNPGNDSGIYFLKLTITNHSSHPCVVFNQALYGNSLRCGGLAYLICKQYGMIAGTPHLQYLEKHVACLPAVLIRNSSGGLIGVYEPGKAVPGAAQYVPLSWAVGGVYASGPGSCFPSGEIVYPDQGYFSLLVHFGPPPAYTASLPPSPETYTAQAIIPLGYIPPLLSSPGYISPFTHKLPRNLDYGTCSHGNAPGSLTELCVPDSVYLYYSKPVTFTIK